LEERDRITDVESGELPRDFERFSGAERSDATLFGFSGSDLRRLGVVLLVAGLALFFGSVLSIMFASDQFSRDPFGSNGSITGSIIFSFILGALGLVLAGFGWSALRFGLVRPVTGYVASEAAPAIASVTESIGRGLASSGGIPVRIEGEQAPATVVRVKCRNCGYLESEDATYCSKCGKPV